MKLKNDFSLRSYNTFGIDARCKSFFEYGSEDELKHFLSGQPSSQLLHVGRGSNLLFVNDFEGTVLHSAIRSLELVGETDDAVDLRVGAGLVWDELVAHCTARGWHGLENLSLIPGEVGAAAVQNIGAYGSEVAQFIVCVDTLRLADGTRLRIERDDCGYGYRRSNFKTAWRGTMAVTHVTLRLSKRFRPDTGYGALAKEITARGLGDSLTPEGLRNLVIEIRRSKLPEPEVLGNAGSFFMNPVVEPNLAESLAEQYPQMPRFDVEGGVKIPAGWLIEQAGLRGKRFGRVGIYEKQALVLVNHGGATGSEVAELSRRVQDEVERKFGIRIEPEVNFIG